MIPTLLDTKTGQIVVPGEDWDSSLYWWAEGNGSCDCNRAIAMGIEDELQEELGLADNICLGSTRIIAIDVTGDLEGFSKEGVLDEINESYPKEVSVKRHDKRP